MIERLNETDMVIWSNTLRENFEDLLFDEGKINEPILKAVSRGKEIN